MILLCVELMRNISNVMAKSTFFLRVSIHFLVNKIHFSFFVYTTAPSSVLAQYNTYLNIFEFLLH